MAPAPVGLVRTAVMLWTHGAFSAAKAAMVAGHATSLPEGKAWYYEPSWAGDRVLAVKDDASVRILTISHAKDVTNRFPVLAALVAKIDATAAAIEATVASVETRQQDAFAAVESMSAPPFGTPALRLIATDLLWVENADTRPWTLLERKRRLRELIGHTAILDPLPLAGPVSDLLFQAKRRGANAVVAKRRNSGYRPFGRSGDWIRVSVDCLPAARPAGLSDFNAFALA